MCENVVNMQPGLRMEVPDPKEGYIETVVLDIRVQGSRLMRKVLRDQLRKTVDSFSNLTLERIRSEGNPDPWTLSDPDKEPEGFK